MADEMIYNKPWIAQRADPFVTYHDGFYYFTA
jgi:GH43 family beta-xylosidase